METKKILLLGSTGMAGHMIYYYLKNTNRYTIINVSYRTKLTEDSILIDIKNSADLEELISTAKPDYIINCIGVLIKGSSDIENAVFINAYFPHFLKKIADKIDAKIIHLSTDCVFSGNEGNYKEDALKDAADIYGLSKSLGEINDAKHLTMRTSIIGPELKSNGEGLLHWFFSQHGEITGYTNAIWSGITTLELAKAIEYYLNNEIASGIVHVTNGEKISKYELLNLFKSVWNVEDLYIREGKFNKNVDKSLSKSETFKYKVPSYYQMIKDLSIWINNNGTLYNYSI
jgi:dTDP-4-dehydrorhamnose reductase